MSIPSPVDVTSSRLLSPFCGAQAARCSKDYKASPSPHQKGGMVPRVRESVASATRSRRPPPRLLLAECLCVYGVRRGRGDIRVVSWPISSPQLAAPLRLPRRRLPPLRPLSSCDTPPTSSPPGLLLHPSLCHPPLVAFELISLLFLSFFLAAISRRSLSSSFL